MVFRTILSLGLFIIISYAIYEVKADRVYLQSSEIYFNRLYVQDYHAEISSDHTNLNVTLSLDKQQRKNIYFNVIIYMKNRRTNRYRKVYNDKPINMCDAAKHANILNNLFLNIVQRSGMGVNCPMKKGNYTWVNLNANNLQLPPFLSGVYRVELLSSFVSGKVIITNLTTFWEVK